MNSKSVLFVNPDYHCTFIHANELKKSGWKVNIIVNSGYPRELLFSNEAIILKRTFSNKFASYLQIIFNSFIYLYYSMRHYYIIIYGDIESFSFQENHTVLSKFLGNSFRFHLSLPKLLGKKIVVVPSGCLEEETKANFSKLDRGNVCTNCGWGDEVCHDIKNISRFDVLRRYADALVGNGSLDSTQFDSTHIKYKAIDLQKWNPNINIPDEFLFKESENIQILHSFFNRGRLKSGRNIKGSQFIVSAVERLRSEGHKVELINLNHTPPQHMRYYQVQADIVVDQLIYGWWGSTGVEAMALGRPTVCYLRPSWKEFFLKTFPEYANLPIVNADASSIYLALKELVTDEEYRRQMGKEARIFAERHYDAIENTKELQRFLNSL